MHDRELLDHESMPRAERGRGRGRGRSSLVAMCVLALAGVVGAGLCVTQLAAERGSSVAWGLFTAETVGCQLRTCHATGAWSSDDGAIRLDTAQLEGDLAVGESVRAGVRWGGFDAAPHEGAVLFTEYSAASRQWMLVAFGATIACLATAPLWGELKRRRRTGPVTT